MSNSIYFFLNGEKYYTESHLTILQMIQYFNYENSLFVIEYNNLIYNQKNWNQLYLKNNDKIEIVTIVGGG